MKQNSNSLQTALVYLIFFLSGAAALVYEISWSRQIGLLFGHTVHAAAITLASYFLGMAIGYWLGARWSGRVSPLLGYGIAELVVAAWAFAIPTLIGISESTAFATWLSSPSLFWQTATRTVFSLLLLLPATIALGVTLPMMAEYLSNGSGSTDNDASPRISFAYSVNTAGALTGVLLATFYLLVSAGVRNASFIAAAVSAICAAGAFFIHYSFVRSPETTGDGQETADSRCESESGPLPTPGPQLVVLAFLGGFGTLALQVLFTRMFSLVFHNSTYTFGIVIAVFLASLAIGAALVSQLQNRFNNRALMGTVSATGALATAASIILFVQLTDLRYFSSGSTFVAYMTGAIFLVAVIVGPAIMCLGMMLPLVWATTGLSKNAGRIVGRLTAVNTVAAASGALLASFFMLPVIGLWQSITLIAAIFLVAGLWLLGSERRFKTALLFGVTTGALLAMRLSNPVESGYDRNDSRERLIQRWNSAYGWIDVVQTRRTGSFKIRQNLHYGFGATGNNAREYRQAHIPLLLHKNPSDVLFTGLGTGLTAGAAIPHQEVERIDAVELIPEVIDAIRLLAEHNYDVVDHPKVKIHIDDARHFLLANKRNYDVIVSDLFVPWESETGYLYTIEHYQVASSRLKDNGLLCQWLPLYQLGEREFRLIANSFASVFPHTTIWWGQLDPGRPVVALIGSHSPIRFDADRVASGLAGLQQNANSIAPLIATPELLFDLYICDWQLQPAAKLNTDEHPRVEFLTPVSNRDRQMIRGTTLRRLFDNDLSKLPSNSVIFPDRGHFESAERRLARQRTILFGH